MSHPGRYCLTQAAEQPTTGTSTSPPPPLSLPPPGTGLPPAAPPTSTSPSPADDRVAFVATSTVASPAAASAATGPAFPSLPTTAPPVPTPPVSPRPIAAAAAPVPAPAGSTADNVMAAFLVGASLRRGGGGEQRSGKKEKSLYRIPSRKWGLQTTFLHRLARTGFDQHHGHSVYFACSWFLPWPWPCSPACHRPKHLA